METFTNARQEQGLADKAPKVGLLRMMVCILVFGCVALIVLPAFTPKSYVPSSAAAQSPGDSVIYLDQAWSQEDREWYYHFSQGSAAISYDIFLNLETADNQSLFRDGLSDPRYGLISDAVSPENPDGLPVGLGKTTVAKPIKGWTAGDYIGMSCAMCHNNELKFNGKRIRIDGGNSSRLNIQNLTHGLDEALQATLNDQSKFDRLAARIGVSGREAKDNLHKRLETDAARIHQYATITTVTPHPWGPGRQDATSLIMDRAVSSLPGIPENWDPAIAPVKPPFLWNSPQALWTQWQGVAQVSIWRNFNESIGVFLPVDATSKSPAEGLFESNGQVMALQRVEADLRRLAPPSWPEDVLGKIDREKALKGKALFVEYCASCHNQWPYRWSEPNKYGKQFVMVGLVPINAIGTDPTLYEVTNTTAVVGGLGPYMPKGYEDQPIVPKFLMTQALAARIRAASLQKLNLSEEQMNDLNGYRELPPNPPDGVYKAGPRDGVWATAPFLHNGSVPNLYEMLIPAAQRTKQFWLGGDFDPVKVGLNTAATSGTFLMNTELKGNSNAGHSFENGRRGNGIIGPLLTDDQRWAIIEYMKSIPEEPGRVTPFGGPK